MTDKFIKQPLVSICIPHYQLKELMTIALRAICKNTMDIPYEVIVVDNGSRDDSLDYLKQLGWVKVIERGDNLPDDIPQVVLTSYDLGFQASQGQYFLTMHADTIVKQPGWLEYLMAPFKNDDKCGAAGSWKLENHNPVYELIKKVTDTKKLRLWIKRNFLGKKDARPFAREICPRDFCAMYNAEIIRRHNLKFAENVKYRGYTAGEQMYYQMKEYGCHTHIFPTMEMMRYVEHINHATAGILPEHYRLNHWRARVKVKRRLNLFYKSSYIQTLLNDNSLDAIS